MTQLKAKITELNSTPLPNTSFQYYSNTDLNDLIKRSGSLSLQLQMDDSIINLTIGRDQIKVSADRSVFLTLNRNNNLEVATSKPSSSFIKFTTLK